MLSLYTTADLARRYGIPVWKVRRLCDRKILPEPVRIMNNRVFVEADLPAIEAALRRVGCIATPEAVA